MGFMSGGMAFSTMSWGTIASVENRRTQMARAIFGTRRFSFFGAGNGSLRARSAAALLFATVWVAGSALAVPCVWTGAEWCRHGDRQC